MKLNRYINARKYYQRVEGYLLQHETTNCLLIGLSRALCNSPRSKDKNFPYLVVVEHDRRVIATAIRTSPQRRLALSKSTDLEAIKLIAEDLAASENKPLPGIIGLKSEALTFALTWQSLTKEDFELAFAMKIHQLDTPKPIAKTSGSLRLATESDRNLLVSWSEAFETEALENHDSKSDYQLWFNGHLKRGSIFVWQDQVAVSMAVCTGATPNGIRINVVYTPPEFRGKGYATSCVATLSQKLLKKGYKYCFLFTNLANPISNHIYSKIGYQPVCEISNYAFKPELDKTN